MERRKVSTANKNSRRNNRSSDSRPNRNESHNNRRPKDSDSLPSAPRGARRDGDSVGRGGKRDSGGNILPPPHILQEYEYATEGAANRILDLAEAESSRRKELEDEYLKFYKKSQRLGMVFGFIIILSVVYATFSLAIAGYEIVAEVLCAVGFLSVALSSYFSKKDRYIPARRRGNNNRRK